MLRARTDAANGGSGSGVSGGCRGSRCGPAPQRPSPEIARVLSFMGVRGTARSHLESMRGVVWFSSFARQTLPGGENRVPSVSIEPPCDAWLRVMRRFSAPCPRFIHFCEPPMGVMLGRSETSVSARRRDKLCCALVLMQLMGAPVRVYRAGAAAVGAVPHHSARRPRSRACCRSWVCAAPARSHLNPICRVLRVDNSSASPPICWAIPGTCVHARSFRSGNGGVMAHFRARSATRKGSER